MFLFLDCTNKNSKNNDNKVVEIVVVEIPDANFKAYLLENFDTDNDGNISLSEAKAVTRINCSGRNINSIDGIESFENLEFMDCSNNQLDEVDVTKNKKLERLICTDNNEGMFIIIGMSSPLRRKTYQAPTGGAPDASNMGNPIDISKCTYDMERTNINLSFNE